MHLASLLIASAFTLGVTAFSPPIFCLTDPMAQQVGKLWRDLIGNYSKVDADAGLTCNYHDYSASALSLNSVCQQAPAPPQKLTDPIFTSRAIFEQAQGSQPPIPSSLLDLWHNCDVVTMRYEMCIMGNCTIPVIGVIALHTVQAPAGNKYPFQINTTYSEFDSEAWVENLQNANACVNPATGNTI